MTTHWIIAIGRPKPWVMAGKAMLTEVSSGTTEVPRPSSTSAERRRPVIRGAARWLSGPIGGSENSTFCVWCPDREFRKTPLPSPRKSGPISTADTGFRRHDTRRGNRTDFRAGTLSARRACREDLGERRGGFVESRAGRLDDLAHRAEAVDLIGMMAQADAHAAPFEPPGIGVALVAQRIVAAGHDKGRRQ